MNIDERRRFGADFVEKLAQAIQHECPEMMPSLFAKIGNAIGVDKYRAEFFATHNRSVDPSIQREDLVSTLRLVCNVIDSAKKHRRKSQ